MAFYRNSYVCQGAARRLHLYQLQFMKQNESFYVCGIWDAHFCDCENYRFWNVTLYSIVPVFSRKVNRRWRQLVFPDFGNWLSYHTVSHTRGRIFKSCVVCCPYAGHVCNLTIRQVVISTQKLLHNEAYRDVYRCISSVAKETRLGLGRLVVKVSVSHTIRDTHTHTHTHTHTW
jgi:hypothetical protein